MAQPPGEKLTMTVEDEGPRLDTFVAAHSELSRSRVQTLLKDGLITLNGAAAKAGTRLSPGDRVEVLVPPPELVQLEAQDIPLDIVYQDEDLVVVDKPAGLTVHPAPGHPDRTLVNAILAVRPDLRREDGNLRPGIVHRLDKDTSGLMVVAISPRAHQSLSGQISGRAVTKKYLTLVEGALTPNRGVIDAPIGRDPRNRQRMAVVSRGRAARTGYAVIEHIRGYTYLEVTLETGRTHQVRVHLYSIGHPVVGDPVYTRGRKEARDLGCPRQFLHSHVLGFKRPADGEYVEFSSELPPDLREVLDGLKAPPPSEKDGDIHGNTG